MTCTYRGHGAVLAMGAPPDRTFAEILGRDGGLCGGKGGSMHLTDVSVGAFGSFAIVGAHLPIASGSRSPRAIEPRTRCQSLLLRRRRGQHRRVPRGAQPCVVWKLPVIFVCENNLYGEYSPLARPRRSSESPSGPASTRCRAASSTATTSFGARVIGQAVDRARAGRGSDARRGDDLRHKGHSRSDPAKYRPRGSSRGGSRETRSSCSSGRLLRRRHLSANSAEQSDGSQRPMLQEALENARSWPPPKLESRFDNIYA